MRRLQWRSPAAFKAADGMKMASTRIYGFDGLRGIGAMLVVLTHYGVFMNTRATAAGMGPGPMSLRFFFVLSGFLITLLLIREQEQFGCVSLTFFYIRRAFRIVPLYVMFLVFLSAVKVFVYPPVAGWRSLLYGWLYLYNFIPRDHYNGVQGHTWSLAVEEHFYLLWPVLFVLLFPRRKAGLMLLCAAAALCAVALDAFLGGQASLARYFVGRWTFTAGGSIFQGCLAALVVTHRAFASRARRIRGSPYLLAACPLLWTGPLWGLDLGLPTTRALQATGFALLVTWLYFNQGALLTRLLDFPPLRYLGQISYGIYVYHGLFLGTGPSRAPGEIWPPDPTVGLLVVCVVAPLSYHGFEKRLTAIGQRFRQRAASPAAPVAPSQAGTDAGLAAEMSP